MVQNQEHAKFDVGEGNTVARITKNGLHFEIIVDMENALKFKKGQLDHVEAEGGRVFSNIKKGDVAARDDLEIAFGTSDINEIAKVIVKSGEVLVDQGYRDAEQEKRIKQVVDFLATNSMDPRSGNPHTPERIRSAIEQAHINIRNAPIDQQMPGIVAQISKLLPIKIATKKVRITIPAIHTGKAYGVISQYKTEETWKNNGDLEMVVEVPSGIIIDFYDKLNGVTHGSALTEEISEE